MNSPPSTRGFSGTNSQSPSETEVGGSVASPAPPAPCRTARTSRPLSRKESEVTPLPARAGTNPSFPLTRVKDFGSPGRPQKWTRKTRPSNRSEFKETLLHAGTGQRRLTPDRHTVVRLRKQVLPGIVPGRPPPPPRRRASLPTRRSRTGAHRARSSGRQGSVGEVRAAQVRDHQEWVTRVRGALKERAVLGPSHCGQDQGGVRPGPRDSAAAGAPGPKRPPPTCAPGPLPPRGTESGGTATRARKTGDGPY